MRIDKANVIVGTIAVVDVASTEINWATIDHCRHAVHFIVPEMSCQDARLAVSVKVNRFDLCGVPIRPEKVLVSYRETERINEIFGNHTRLFRVSVKTCKIKC